MVTSDLNSDQKAWELAARIHDEVILHAENFSCESDKLDFMAEKIHGTLNKIRAEYAELERAAREVVKLIKDGNRSIENVYTFSDAGLLEHVVGNLAALTERGENGEVEDV